MQKAKTILFLFSNRNLKATKEHFFSFKNNDMQCIKDKTLIYMHIKKLYVPFIFLLYMQNIITYKLKYAYNKNKEKGTPPIQPPNRL